MWQNIKSFNDRWGALSFFILGFLFDIWSLGDIDSLFGILKQAVYLIVIGSLIGTEVLIFAEKYKPEGRIARLWEYHEAVIHFLLGSLLSEYTLFFFKSASLWSSFVFLGLLGLLLVINEFKQLKGGNGIPLRMSLFALCLASFFVYLIPILLRFIGVFPFIISLMASIVGAYPLLRWISRRLLDRRDIFYKQVLAPIAAVYAAFVALYFTALIPPIPLSIGYLGVFHEVKRESGNYILGYDPRGKRFWQNGEAVFLARPGDRLYSFVRVSSPRQFADQVQVRWLLKDARAGWQTSDVIPMQITGRRAEGFRGFTYKSNYTPGQWQVRIETTDGREMGRMYFKIESDATTEPRELAVVVQ